MVTTANTWALRPHKQLRHICQTIALLLPLSANICKFPDFRFIHSLVCVGAHKRPESVEFVRAGVTGVYLQYSACCMGAGIETSILIIEQEALPTIQASLQPQVHKTKLVYFRTELFAFT